MVLSEGEGANSFFEVLDEWERHLCGLKAFDTVIQDNDPRCRMRISARDFENAAAKPVGKRADPSLRLSFEEKAALLEAANHASGGLYQSKAL